MVTTNEKQALEEALRKLDEVEGLDKQALEQALELLRSAAAQLEQSKVRRESTEEKLKRAREAIERLTR